MAKGKILIADDEEILTASLQKILSSEGYSASVCNHGDQFLTMVSTTNPEMIILDIYYGEYNGIRLLTQMRAQGIDIPVILMTAYAEVSLAVQAMKEGAYDFVVKPFDLKHLSVLVAKTMEYGRLQRKVKVLEEEIESHKPKHGIIGKSAIIRQLLGTAERLAVGENTTVLIEGESGTGKELFAHFLHQKSPRADKPFITINCGAIPKDLAESEFFGYEKGAFTGAYERMKQGKFELASGGTLLLDEVGELSQEMQVKLLRVLEDQKFYRLGGTKEINVDVRIIAATNRNLQNEVEQGRFREDLFYRLNVAVIRIPPLRERREDITPISMAFLQEFSVKFNKKMPVLQSEAVQLLENSYWKGNVRELRNIVERVVLLSDAETLGREQFSFMNPPAPMHGSGGKINGKFSLVIPSQGISMKEVLRDLILKTLSITNGNQVQASKILGITRSKLRYRMEQLGIQPEQRGYKVNA
ncbi:MAG: sigma-54-dependent Fis family transcriptional regulator [Bacteroidetes bacterium]|nr:sigma-54-dependent Fis family transcriptional regulator [Bacteroidota bacterium]